MDLSELKQSLKHANDYKRANYVEGYKDNMYVDIDEVYKKYVKTEDLDEASEKIKNTNSLDEAENDFWDDPNSF